MKTSLIASVLFIASAPFAYAQQTQELAPIDASIMTQEVTVQQLANETGLSPRHVRMVLGSRTDHADYRIVYAKKERQFRQALGEERYQDLLAGLPVQRLAVRGDRDCIWAQFTLQVDDREAVIARLNAAGVPTAIHYPKPLHLQPAYANCCRVPAPLPHAEAAARRVLSLPMSADLQPAQQNQVVAVLRSALAAQG